MSETKTVKTDRGSGGGRHGFNRPVEKPKNFKGTMVKLMRYCKKYIPAISVALVTALAGTVLQIIGPDLLKDMTNEITKGLPALINGVPVVQTIDLRAVSSIAWLLTLIYAISLLLNLVQGQIMATITQRIAKTMRADISRKINRLPLKYFDKNSYGDVLSRVTNDVDAIGQTLNQSLGTLVIAVTMFFGSLIMMFHNNWIMALTAVSSSLVGFVLMILIMAKSQKHFITQQKELGQINGHIEEIYSGHNVVKVYNGGKAARKTFEEKGCDHAG